jgi:hypothetical protein
VGMSMGVWPYTPPLFYRRVWLLHGLYLLGAAAEAQGEGLATRRTFTPSSFTAPYNTASPPLLLLGRGLVRHVCSRLKLHRPPLALRPRNVLCLHPSSIRL